MKHARQLAQSDSEVFQNTTQSPPPTIKIWYVRKSSIPGIDSSELHETRTGERILLDTERNLHDEDPLSCTLIYDSRAQSLDEFVG